MATGTSAPLTKTRNDHDSPKSVRGADIMKSVGLSGSMPESGKDTCATTRRSEEIISIPTIPCEVGNKGRIASETLLRLSILNGIAYSRYGMEPRSSPKTKQTREERQK